MFSFLLGEQIRLFFSTLSAFWYYTWWFIVPIFLAPLFWRAWMWYIQGEFIKNLEWSLLRVRVPREVLKTPKSMEQVFAAAHGTYSFGARPFQKYWKGEIEKWTSFEIVGDSTGVHFYIRIVSDSRKMIESAIYAQYPDAEIELVDDYTEKFPTILPNAMYDVAGSDYILALDSSLPIRTYEYFEAKEEEEKIDTIATLMEAMMNHKGEETTWIQLIIRPVGTATSDWIKKAEEYRTKKLLSKEGKRASIMEHIIAGFKNAFLSMFIKEEDLKWPEDKPDEKFKPVDLTPAQKAKLEAIDMKISKLAFEAVLRWVHIDRKETFDTTATGGIRGWAKQFIDENLNGLRPHLPTYTVVVRQPFKKRKSYLKKRRIYDAARFRRFPSRYSIMNIEELATLYHFPSATVKVPIPRIEAKKGVPPSGLAIE